MAERNIVPHLEAKAADGNSVFLNQNSTKARTLPGKTKLDRYHYT